MLWMISLCMVRFEKSSFPCCLLNVNICPLVGSIGFLLRLIIIFFFSKIMPKLVPFFFVNEITFTFVIIALTVYILSKYILPRFVRLFLSRTFISKLLDNSINK